MKSATPYSVWLRDLPTHRRLEVTSARVDEWLRGLPMRDALNAPEGDPQAGRGVADVDLYADGDNVFVAGTFRGELQVACSRCINPVTIPIDETLRVTFMPRHAMPAEEDDEPAAEDGPEVAEEDLDLFPYDGEAVDLEPLLREQFVLAVPYAPLCREDCKGLCPQCGIDRNTDTCHCEAP